MAIDVGAACIDRSSFYATIWTIVGAENPANANGTIDYVCMWFYADPSNFEVASFVDEGSNVLSTNGTIALPDRGVGQQEYNAPGDFTAFNINSGEHIGFRMSAGSFERDLSGSGYWGGAGDLIPCSSVSFTWYANRTISLYATGTEAGGVTMPIFMSNYLRQMEA
jgi:hypothetical protein